MSDAFALDDGEAVGVRVVDMRRPGEIFERARLVDVRFERCDLSGCDFSEAVWRRVTLTDCRVTGLELPQARLQDVTFTDCRLDDANVRLARLERVRFDRCVLIKAEFVGAQLADITFPSCDLTAADFSQARCAHVDLRDARLDSLRGIGSLQGATINVDQLVGLAAGLAHAVGITIAGRT
jgi:uncharacterized protein YjbI with pentapeptide repeats